MGTKRCRKCSQELPLSSFGKDRSTADGLSSYCKPCKREYMRGVKRKIKERTNNRCSCGTLISPAYSKCHPCMMRATTEKRVRGRRIAAEDRVAAGEKKCSGCQKIKSFEEFVDTPRSLDGKSFRCRECLALSQYRSNAKRRDLSWELSGAQFRELYRRPCQYCGESPSRGVDRVDNNLPYVVSNSTPCCAECNRMKHSSEIQDWLRHVVKIAAYQGKM